MINYYDVDITSYLYIMTVIDNKTVEFSKKGVVEPFTYQIHKGLLFSDGFNVVQEHLDLFKNRQNYFKLEHKHKGKNIEVFYVDKLGLCQPPKFAETFELF